MKETEKSVLKIYSSTTDKAGNKILYQYVVILAREKGIAGVTVYRGIMGYGLSSGQISSSNYWEITEKLPVMIEIIDETEVLEEFFKLIKPVLEKAAKGILITMEPVRILMHKSGSRAV